MTAKRHRAPEVVTQTLDKTIQSATTSSTTTSIATGTVSNESTLEAWADSVGVPFDAICQAAAVDIDHDGTIAGLEFLTRRYMFATGFDTAQPPGVYASYELGLPRDHVFIVDDELEHLAILTLFDLAAPAIAVTDPNADDLAMLAESLAGRDVTIITRADARSKATPALLDVLPRAVVVTRSNSLWDDLTTSQRDGLAASLRIARRDAIAVAA